MPHLVMKMHRTVIKCVVITLTRRRHILAKMIRTCICVGQYSVILYTQNMQVQLKIVTGNPQVTRKLTEFSQICCMGNTRPKLSFRSSVMTSYIICFMRNIYHHSLFGSHWQCSIG